MSQWMVGLLGWLFVHFDEHYIVRELLEIVSLLINPVSYNNNCSIVVH